MAFPYKPPTGIITSTRTNEASSERSECVSKLSDSYSIVSRRREGTGYCTPQNEMIIDSHQVCNVVYEEWLEKKQKEKMFSAKAIRERKMKEEEIVLEKQVSWTITFR